MKILAAQKSCGGLAASLNQIMFGLKNFVHDIPITLKESIIAPKRLFDKAIVDEVTPAMNELIREDVVVEATDNIAIVSNLLPVSKPTANYSLKSKIDKSLQLNSKQNMNRSRITLDIRECNKYINTSPSSPYLRYHI